MIDVEYIMKDLKKSKSYCYRLLQQLQKEFKLDYPESLIIRGRLSKSYYERKIKGEEYEKKSQIKTMG